MIDLHTHSTASDGTCTPHALVGLAASLGLEALALTDHDSVDGIAEAIEAASSTGVEIVPGVELSASHDGRDLHVLGYFIDHHDMALRNRLVLLREARVERASAMVDELAAAGHDVCLDDVMARASGGAVGRTHVARALVDAGAVDSVEDAFARLIGRDGPFYVKKPLLPAAEAIGIIRDAGGVAVLAHPGVSDAEDLVGTLSACGLAGIEAYHREHDEQTRERYVIIAEYLGLVITGGSDYHGGCGRNDPLGVPFDLRPALGQLRARARATNV